MEQTLVAIIVLVAVAFIALKLLGFLMRSKAQGGSCGHCCGGGCGTKNAEPDSPTTIRPRSSSES